MDLEPSTDQVALRDELRRFLAARVTPTSRRAAGARPGAVDRSLWAELGAMGVFTLPVPEGDGGVGLGWAEAVIAFEELGRAAVPGPLVGTAVAAAVGAPGTVVGLVERSPTAVVEHLDALDALIVLDGAGAAIVEDLPAGTAPRPRPLDPLTPVTVVDLPAGRHLDGDAAALRRTGALLASALQVGLGQAAVELGAAYARERHQFGRVIGSFQAVKHLLADAAVAVEVARAAVHAAAVEVDEGGAGAGRAVATARVVASTAGRSATEAAIQVHGGIGYTWELDAHLLLKRVLVLDVAPSTVEDALAALAAGVLEPA